MQKPIQILNVDDQEASRYAVTRVLRQEGFSVTEGANAADALRLAMEEPDLIILDVRLPDMNGFDVCRKIKSEPATSMIPVLLLTSTYQDDESKVKGLDSGADGYLTQPIEPPVLIAYINALLRARKAEEGLVAAGREWESTFDAISDSIALLDLDGIIRRCNKAFASFVGKPMVEVIDRTMWEIMDCATEAADCDRLRLMLQSGQRESEVLRKGDKWYNVAVDPVSDKAGNPTGAIYVMSDITELKRMEEALRESKNHYRSLSESLDALVKRKVAELQQAETLAAVGRMVASVAHEVRNPLQRIRMGIDSIRPELQGNDTKQEILEEIDGGLTTLNQIIQELLDYSKPIQPHVRPRTVQNIVQQALKALTEEIRDVNVELELEDENRKVPVDGEMMNRVLVNVISNAVEAMPNGGTLRISSRFEYEGGRNLLKLNVADTGCGIKEEDLRLIFEPFFTTKRQGTGLGISISKKIIEAHKGGIRVESELNKGTTVEIKIPVEPAPRRAKGQSNKAEKSKLIKREK
jgi:PAS domain S-box-containing protein